jgi:hypothetical protein
MKVQFRKVITVEGHVFDEGSCLRIVAFGARTGQEWLVAKENILYAEEIVSRSTEIYKSEVKEDAKERPK